MPTTAKMKIVVLFDDEVRTAARALDKVRAMTPESDDEGYARAVWAALDACSAALYGAEDDTATVMLGAKPLVRRKR